MANIIIDEPIVMRLSRSDSGMKERNNLRELIQALEPLAPMLEFLAELSIRNPELYSKNFELAQTGITIPLKNIANLMIVLDRIKRDSNR